MSLKSLIATLAGLLLAGPVAARDQVVIYDYPTFAREGRRPAPAGLRAMAAAYAPTVGVRRVAVVNATWPGTAPIVSNSTALNVIDQVEAFYSASSYGQLSFASAVYGPYTLPSKTCDFYSIKSQVKAALDPDVDFAQIDHVIAFGPFSGCGWSGISTVGQWQEATNEGVVPLAVSIMPSTSLTTTEHETGHGIGMGHAESLACPGGGIAAGTKELCSRYSYGDPYDVMARSSYQPGGRMRDYLGWLTGRIAVVESSGTWALTNLESPTGVSVLKVRRSFNDYLYITQRAGIGIVLHALANETYGYERTEQIPYTGSLYFRRMLPGESYTDPTGLRVDVESDGRMTVWHVTPDTDFPTVTLTSPTQGQTVSGSVNIAADIPGAYLGRATAAQNGQLLFGAYDTYAPFAWAWDSSTAVGGVPVGINVRGCDVAGNCSYGSGLTVYPSNAATPTPQPTATRTPTPNRTPARTPTKKCRGNSWRCR